MRANTARTSGYELLSAFGHRVNRTFPAIVQLTADTKKDQASCRHKVGVRRHRRGGPPKPNRTRRGAFHRLRPFGPPVLQVSRIISKNGSGQIILDLCPDLSKQQIESEIAARAAAFSNRDCMELLTGFINKRLGQTAVNAREFPFRQGARLWGKKKFQTLPTALKALPSR